MSTNRPHPFRIIHNNPTQINKFHSVISVMRPDVDLAIPYFYFFNTTL